MIEFLSSEAGTNFVINLLLLISAVVFAVIGFIISIYLFI